VNRLDSDCEKARVWVGGVKSAVRRANRVPEAVNGADERDGVAMAETEEVRENREEDRSSRLKRGKTVFLDAIVWNFRRPRCDLLTGNGHDLRR
jgi:hypothetical protein